jgi:hypothetical protein
MNLSNGLLNKIYRLEVALLDSSYLSYNLHQKDLD